MLRYGFGAPTGIDLPGEEQGIVPPPARLVGLLDRQPADRPGRVGHADADGDRLRRDRQRRHPARAAHRPSVGGVARAAAARRSGSSRPSGLRASCARCSRACSRPGGTASEIPIPGYELAGKTGTANKVVNGTYSNKKYVASFVGFAPARDPEDRGDRRRRSARRTGAIYGTEVAGARVAADHELRAAAT